MATTRFPRSIGFIQIAFVDARTDETLVLGGLGYVTSTELDSAWAEVPAFEGQSCFQADRLDASKELVCDRSISAEACEQLLGKPIATLIERGRARLRAQLHRPAGRLACA
ncbi:hypothetical protein [Ottowia sp.]|uniref:hypothetical protein n=1 Tax=Ottowia sp. TaxID=1898956 RepID=UPI0025DD47D9|nr:hypothetical protein [Ottowia sp.]MBK6616276.1 hypothetical protein [Ottowia sp.]